MDQQTSQIVEIAQGKLKGFAKDGVLRFNGIPYAKALRWRMPEAALPWSGVRDANAFGPISPQIVSAAEAMLGGTPGEKSEDCLYLNIATPACDGAKRPVMVWIHGGAFVTGAGSVGTYNGKYLAAMGDVVVVTINYRLGALGFLNLADATDGNLPGRGAEGIADQIVALKWVHANIASFGGDAGNVTIFGESAGAMSVAALLAAPAARGLFHKAIAQSGGADVGHTREHSAKIARLVLDKLGVAPADAGRLAYASWETILGAQKEVLAVPRETGGLPFAPTIDERILPLRPIRAIREGSAKGVAVLTGTTRDEWKLFTAAAAHLRLMDGARLKKMTADLAGEEQAEALLAAYTEGSPFERWNAVMTDKSFAVPAVRLVEAQAPHASVYLYRFDWSSPLLGGILGSCHAMEIGFVFGTYKEKLAGAFFGTGARADALSHAMMQSWIAFAKSGNPSAAGGGAWPVYDAQRHVMIFGDGAPHVSEAPNEARRKIWDALSENTIGL